MGTGFGRVYRWCPGHVVLECGCGERSVLPAPQPPAGVGWTTRPLSRKSPSPVGLETKRFAPGAMPGTAKTPAYPIQRALAARLAAPSAGA